MTLLKGVDKIITSFSKVYRKKGLHGVGYDDNNSKLNNTKKNSDTHNVDNHNNKNNYENKNAAINYSSNDSKINNARFEGVLKDLCRPEDLWFLLRAQDNVGP